jgi:hypothetical protein
MLREEHRLRVFENRVLKRICAGSWRKLHNEELHNLYSLANMRRMIKSRRMTWVGQVVYIGETRNVHRILVAKPEGRKPLEIPRHR